MARKKNKPRKVTHNLVAIGATGLVWKFLPSDLPGLQNMMPILCSIKTGGAKNAG